MSATKLNDAGPWRSATKVSVNDAGTWRIIKSIKVNDAGTWRTVFQGDVITLSNQSLSTTFDPGAIMSYRLNDSGVVDGVVYQDYNGSESALENWITPTADAGAAWEAMATVNSLTGSLLGSTTGSWLSLAGNLVWGLQNDTFTASSCNLTVQIREAASGTVRASATITIRTSPGA